MAKHDEPRLVWRTPAIEGGRMTPCRPGSHRCAVLALWFLNNSLARRIAADCERNRQDTQP